MFGLVFHLCCNEYRVNIRWGLVIMIVTHVLVGLDYGGGGESSGGCMVGVMYSTVPCFFSPLFPWLE